MGDASEVVYSEDAQHHKGLVMLYDIPVSVDKTQMEYNGGPTILQGYKPILAWRQKWLPWCDVDFDDLTISYMPPAFDDEDQMMYPGEIICASLATLLHEIGHILEAGQERVFYQDYNLNDLMEVEWRPKNPAQGAWSLFDLNSYDHNRTIQIELQVCYLVYDLLYKTFPRRRKEDLQILFYDDPERFQPEYWQSVIDTPDGFDEAPEWVYALSKRLWDTHKEMMQDLVDALKEALTIREVARNGNREKVSDSSG